MKKLVYQLIFVLLLLSLVASSCSSGNRMGGTSKKCGCGMNRGFVGY
jgi:hypothetical protein